MWPESLVLGTPRDFRQNSLVTRRCGRIRNRQSFLSKLIFLEFNEVNFDFIEKYLSEQDFPNFRRFIDAHGLCKTTSEHEFHKLEPWIQWVTAHTGLDADSHGIFRLGDIVNSDIPQIWEELEREKNLTVAAISPMNARNAAARPAFFIPDPWTKTSVSGSWDLRQLSSSINQLVNENAHSRMTLSSIFGLLAGGLRNARIGSARTYASLVAGAARKRWLKALVLDRLLADTLITQWRKHRPDFTTLFLNAGAHIQHHYMYQSPCYDGPHKGSNDGVPEGTDPLLDAYRLYDQILGDVMKAAPDARIMFGTGLSQLPNPRLIHYYRPRDHKALLDMLGVEFVDALPRMSRDFLVVCESDGAARQAEAKLASVRAAHNDAPVFSIENRGSDLFCMLAYTDKIGADFSVTFSDGRIDNFDRHISLVTIENGIHRSTGFFSDSGISSQQLPSKLELTQIFTRVKKAFDGRTVSSPGDVAYQT